MRSSREYCDLCQDDGYYYDPDTGKETSCVDCCEHNELDHGICLDCGKDTEGLWIKKRYRHE